MKTKRKSAPRPRVAQVICLDAYRKARAVTDQAARGRDSVVDAYCRWLSLAGAFWAFWW